jgi:4-hydroxy-2-oxoheptanedioate aldolase
MGGPVYGTLIVSPSPIWVRALEGANLDFVFIDTEHIPLDREKVSFMCQLYKNSNLAPIVRITEPNATLAAATLDGGAVGIIAPYVESAAQVRELVGAVKFRPLKGQRLQRALDGEKLEPALQAYLDKANAPNVLIVNIESVPALENLDEILAVPGLDSILIGPHDLSCSLGIPEQYNHPKFEAAVQTIIKKSRAANIGAGMHFWSDMEKEVNWLKSGLNMLIHSGDISIFGKHLQLELQAIKDAVAAKTRTPINNHHMPNVPQQIVV